MLDLTLAVAGLIVLAPVLMILAAVIRVILGKPVLFRQQRPGKQGRPFQILKFRTMTGAVDSAGRARSDEQRMTRFGRILRATSLDELPELWNIVRGEMSLVGPRPLLTEYLERYLPEQARRHEVLPGLTGLAQIRGRNAITWEEKFACDVYYVDHCSFLLDLKILALTPIRVVQGRGVSAEGHATVPKFEGSAARKVA